MTTLVKWTVEDYHRMIEAGILSERRCELIGGKIVEMAPEGPLHRFINETVGDYLRQQLGTAALVSEAHPITLVDSEPEPDIAIIQPPRSRYRNRHPAPQDIYWLIEVADTTLAEDTGEKLTAYAKAGIPEYWVIDVQRSQVKVFRQPLEEQYRSETTVTAGTVSPLAFADVAISVERLLGVRNSETQL
ncbi:MAG: Uma2 family endonuclease [Cyanophyceae cyanobacterium]